jgi:hypothetical protein
VRRYNVRGCERVRSERKIKIKKSGRWTDPLPQNSNKSFEILSSAIKVLTKRNYI